MHFEKDIFFVTKQSKQLPVEVIIENLCKLLTSAQLEILPATIAINCQSLIGKEILHRWKDEDGQKRWYKGKVLNLIPGTTDWFNVKYNGEEDVFNTQFIVWHWERRPWCTSTLNMLYHCMGIFIISVQCIEIWSLIHVTNSVWSFLEGGHYFCIPWQYNCMCVSNFILKYWSEFR